MGFEYLWIVILGVIALAWVLYVLSSMFPILTRQLTFKEWWKIAQYDEVIIVGLMIAIMALCAVFFISLFQYIDKMVHI